MMKSRVSITSPKEKFLCDNRAMVGFIGVGVDTKFFYLNPVPVRCDPLAPLPTQTPTARSTSTSLPSPTQLPCATPRTTATSTSTSTPAPTPPPFERMLLLTEPPMQGDDVQLVQERLLTLGYTEVGTPDGGFGSLTDQAVHLFQEVNNLEVDGVVGQNT